MVPQTHHNRKETVRLRLNHSRTSQLFLKTNQIDAIHQMESAQHRPSLANPSINCGVNGIHLGGIKARTDSDVLTPATMGRD